ncbi:MAG: flagellar hook-basal body complex protein [Thermoleophilia bacterium]
MIEALYAAASGMLSQQTGLDVVANNLANASTVGFKRDRMDQVDLAYQTFQLPSGTTGQLGLGAGPGRMSKEWDAGEAQQTGGQYDVAIDGPGFLKVKLADGTPAYTRAGAMQVSADGRLELASGQPIEPPIKIDANAENVTVGTDGKITATVGGAPKTWQIQLTTFPNAGGLTALGGSLFAQSPNSGAPTTGNPGANGTGSLLPGYTEGSNVQVADEMVSMIAIQRAFEASSKVVSASDEMWGMANGLRR